MNFNTNPGKQDGQGKDPLRLILLCLIILMIVGVFALGASYAMKNFSLGSLLPVKKEAKQVVQTQSVEKIEKHTPQTIKLAQIGCTINEISSDLMSLGCMVYNENHDISLSLDSIEKSKIIKYALKDDDQSVGLAQFEMKHFSYDELAKGDYVTIHFPLEVALADIGGSEMDIKQVSVMEDFEISQVSE